jgi:hypothetical protein
MAAYRAHPLPGTHIDAGDAAFALLFRVGQTEHGRFHTSEVHDLYSSPKVILEELRSQPSVAMVWSCLTAKQASTINQVRSNFFFQLDDFRSTAKTFVRILTNHPFSFYIH